MRGTRHNGRTRKNGTPYDPDHNDRTSDRQLQNIDEKRTPLNRYWAIGSPKWYKPSEPGKPSFSEVEATYYERHFRPMYDASVERSRKRGQLKRVRPFEEWRQSRQFVPEETYLQVGCVDDGTVDNKTFISCVVEYLNREKAWNDAHNRPFTVLTGAFHFDEAIPQFHQRKVWHSVDPETGIDEIGQEKALRRAGIPLPDPEKPEGKDNNRKMTFDAAMREIWLDILESHGLEVEREPLKGVNHNQSKGQWLEEKAKQNAKKIGHETRRKKNDALNDAIKYQTDAEAAVDEYVGKAQGVVDLLKIELSQTEKAIAKKAQELGDMADYPAFRQKLAAERAQEEQEKQEAARREQEAREAQKAVKRSQETAVAPAVALERLEQDVEEMTQVSREISHEGAMSRMKAMLKGQLPPAPTTASKPENPGLG